MGKHIAFKCTYNNGDEGTFVGFNGICSEEIIKWNIENQRVWCRQEINPCKQYLANGFKGKRPISDCYESFLFRDWKFGAGWNHSGIMSNTPRRALKVEQDKIAVLTTRFPRDREEDRKIVGLFKIGKVTNNPGEETFVLADEKFRFRLLLYEAKELNFWDYYSHRGEPKWDSGLFRYLSDEQVCAILLDLKKTIQDRRENEKIRKLLEQSFSSVSPSQPSGPRIRKSGDRTKRVMVKRKYGPGGEGKNHRKLKEWIAKNPEEIGLYDVINTHKEYRFISGDTVDIFFEREGNKITVVEIETTDPHPGSHQALKYKTLSCAERGFDITSSEVEAVLVAWSIPEETKRFCKKYGIQTTEKMI